MKITDSFFTGGTRRDMAPYLLPAKGTRYAGYAFAEFEAARKAIKQVFTEPNWDGYGALPIADVTKNNALAAITQFESLANAPEVVSNPNGTLSLSWETSYGFSQLEIGRTRYSFYVQPHKGSAYLANGDLSEVNCTIGMIVDAVLYPKPSNPVGYQPADV